MANRCRGGAPAIIGGVYQEGYSGSIGGGGFSIVPGVPFDSWEEVEIQVSVSDFSGNAVSYSYIYYCEDTIPCTVDNRVPSDGALNVPTNTPIFFRVMDYQTEPNPNKITAVVDGNAAITDGVFQPGFSGAITPVTEGYGYEVSIFRPTEFSPNATVSISVSTEDNDLNTDTAVWSFTTEDTVPPVVTGESPPDGAVDVPGTPEIVVDIVDADTPGPQSALEVTVQGEIAVLGGVIQPGYTGTVTPITGGYRIAVTRDACFPAGRTITVTASGDDGAGNTAEKTWSFKTAVPTTYLMRGWNSGLGYVYWETEDPDPAGALAPASPLLDIVVCEVIEGGCKTYLMRAWHAAGSSYVFWTVEEEPDLTGVSAPVPAGELIDVVIFEILMQAPEPDTTDVLLLESGYPVLLESGGTIPLE